MENKLKDEAYNIIASRLGFSYTRNTPVVKNINDAHRCQEGYEWLLWDNSGKDYTIYRCSAGGHLCIVLKKPRKKKKAESKKLVKDKEGNLIKKNKSNEDNIFE